MPRRSWVRRLRKQVRRKYRRMTKSPKIRLFGLFVSVLLVMLKLAELIHQVASVLS